MKFYDYNESRHLSLVSDDGGGDSRYEQIKLTGAAPFEACPLVYLRQRHYVANAIAQGVVIVSAQDVVIVGKRIDVVPSEWKRSSSAPSV